MISHCERHEIGEMTQPNEFPPRRVPWALDNGAFALWKSGRPFDGDRFGDVCARARRYETPPDFVVCPDVVAGGLDSLALSLDWERQLRPYGFRLALVVQDGMTRDDVVPVLDRFAVLFVGGSLEWKLETMKAWADIAHEHGLECHVGRIGSRNRIMAAKRAGVDSVDSCTPLWSEANMWTFTSGMQDPAQGLLWGHLERPARQLSDTMRRAQSVGGDPWIG